MQPFLSSRTEPGREHRLCSLEVVEGGHFLQAVRRREQIDARVIAKPDPIAVSLWRCEIERSGMNEDARIARTASHPGFRLIGRPASPKLRRRGVTLIDPREPGIASTDREDRSDLRQLADRPSGRIHQPDSDWKLFELVCDQIDTGRIEVSDGEAHRIRWDRDIEYFLGRLR